MQGILQHLKIFLYKLTSGIKTARHLRLSNLRKAFSLMGKKEKRILYSLLAVCALSLFFSARGFYLTNTKIAPGTGGNYSEGILGYPAFINPVLALSEPDQDILTLVYSGLYKYAKNGKLIADLAESLPEISTDKKTYIIKLKKNARWHGYEKTLNADDVIYTISTIKDPAFKSPFKAQWQSTSIEKIDDYTIKFSTKDVSGPFLQNLTVPIMPKFLWSKVESKSFYLSDLNLQPIGTGPYFISQIKKLNNGKIVQINLEANPDYYMGRPKIDEVIFKFYDTDSALINGLHSREIDSLAFIPLERNLFLDKKRTNFKIISQPILEYQIAFFNLNNKILSDLNVRKALFVSANRQQIIEDIFLGNAVAPLSPLSDNPIWQQNMSGDREQAGKILDAAGWQINTVTGERNKKDQILELTLASNDFPLNAKSAELLAHQWRALGVKINLKILPQKQLAENIIRPRDFDILLYAQKFNPDPDPFQSWHSSQIKDPGLNISGLNDSEIDKLTNNARNTIDEKQRQAIYAELDAKLYEKQPLILLNQQILQMALPQNLKGDVFEILKNPLHRFYFLPDWYLSETRVWK